VGHPQHGLVVVAFCGGSTAVVSSLGTVEEICIYFPKYVPGIRSYHSCLSSFLLSMEGDSKGRSGDYAVGKRINLPCNAL
jgi:hypothetical protein